jgi:hypothetical protein
MFSSNTLRRGSGPASDSCPLASRELLCMALLVALIFAGSLQVHAQFTLPGGVRVQVPNGRPPAPRNLPARESPTASVRTWSAG